MNTKATMTNLSG